MHTARHAARRPSRRRRGRVRAARRRPWPCDSRRHVPSVSSSSRWIVDIDATSASRAADGSGSSSRATCIRDPRSSAANDSRPGSGQQEVTAARIVFVPPALDEAGGFEPAQDPRDVARVDHEVARELAGRWRVPVRELVEQPRLGERPLAVEQPLVQQSEPLRVEAVVAADRGDRVVREIGSGRGEAGLSDASGTAIGGERACRPMLDSGNYTPQARLGCLTVARDLRGGVLGRTCLIGWPKSCITRPVSAKLSLLCPPARGLVLTPLGFSLLRQLSDGAFHSGEDLAAKVGLTRARVSQLLRQAETAGLSLERVRGRGYRLVAAPDFLDAAAGSLGPDRVRRHAGEQRPVAAASAARRRHRADRRGNRVGDPAVAADPSRDRRPARFDVERVAAPRAASRHPRRRARGRVADRRTRPPRSNLDCGRRRQPDVLAGLAVRAGCRLPCRAFARSRRRRDPRAGEGRPRGRQSQVAERPHPSAPEGRRHPRRAERRRARSVDGRRRRRPQCAAAARAAPRHRAAGHRPHVGGRARRAADRSQPPARAPRRRARGHAAASTRRKDSRRSRPNGSIGMPTRANRSACCCPTALR